MKLRGLPSVEQLLQTQQAAELIASYGRPLTLQAIRNVLDLIRARATAGETTQPGREGLLDQALGTLRPGVDEGPGERAGEGGVGGQAQVAAGPGCQQ